MEVKAIAKYVRSSPSKMRKVTQIIKDKRVEEALNILSFMPKARSGIIEKVLKSALANAENNLGLSAANLYVKNALIDQGSTLKRTKPRARGRADLMRRRTSHITIILESRE